MRFTTSLGFGLAGAFTLALAPIASAQMVDAPVRSVSFGIVAGVNVASIAGNDVSGMDSRVGFLVGGSVLLPITPTIAFQPELLYAQKGASTDVNDGDFTGDGEVRLTYIEAPLPLRFDVPTTGVVRPFILAGPSIALNTSCEIEASSMGASLTVGCDDFVDDGAAAIDFGGLVGGGLEFPMGTRAFSVGVRYTFGLKEIFAESDAKNRALGIVAGLRF